MWISPYRGDYWRFILKTVNGPWVCRSSPRWGKTLIGALRVGRRNFSQTNSVESWCHELSSLILVRLMLSWKFERSGITTSSLSFVGWYMTTPLQHGKHHLLCKALYILSHNEKLWHQNIFLSYKLSSTVCTKTSGASGGKGNKPRT